MDLVKDDFIGMIQFIETRKKCKRSNHCKRDPANFPLRIRFSGIRTSILSSVSPSQSKEHSMQTKYASQSRGVPLAVSGESRQCPSLDGVIFPLTFLDGREVANLRRDVLPLLCSLLRWLSIVVEILEVYRRQVDAPRGYRAGEEVLQGSEPELLHPYRLVAYA